MRFILPTTIAALSVTVVATEQAPLGDLVRGWIDKAKSFLPIDAQSVPKPLDSGASHVANKLVQPLTLENWQSVLQPASAGGADEWAIYVTGGNSTCFGMCGNVTEAWTESVAGLSASPKTPKLAVIDCEQQRLLCHSWLAAPPSLWHVQFPESGDGSQPTIHILDLARNSTASDLRKVFTEEKWNTKAPYDGLFHPFGGFMQEYGLAVPFGYLNWGISRFPSWVPMIALSFVSRSFMKPRARTGAGGANPAAGGTAR